MVPLAISVLTCLKEALPEGAPMYQKLFIAYSTAEGDEEFFVTFRLDRLMTFDFVKSTATTCASLQSLSMLTPDTFRRD